MTGTLLIGNFLSGSLGNRGSCEDLAEGLRARGRTLVSASSEPGRIARMADMLATTWIARRRYAVALVDVFSGPSFRWAEAVCGLLRVLKRPYVLTLRGGALPEFAERYPVRVRRLLRAAAAVTSPSRYVAEGLAGFRGDIIWLPNSIDVRAFVFRERSAPRPRLCWLRAIHRDYNPVLAVKVVALLKAEFPDIELVMYGADRGDGSLPEVKRAMRDLSVEGSVRFGGAVPFKDVPARLSESDVFLNTTNYDSFGVSVVQAAACGLCIVSSDAGALPEIWTDGEDALLTPRSDAQAMARAIRRVLTEDGLARRLSRNARCTAAKYDRESVLTRWEELLDLVEREGRV